MNKLKPEGKELEVIFGCFVDKLIIINDSWLFGGLLNVVKGILNFFD